MDLCSLEPYCSRVSCPSNAVIHFLHTPLQTDAFILYSLSKECACTACVCSNGGPLFVGQCAEWNELAWLPYEGSQGEGPATRVLCSVQTSPRTQGVRTWKSARSSFIVVRISYLQIITVSIKQKKSTCFLFNSEYLNILFIKRQLRKVRYQELENFA